MTTRIRLFNKSGLLIYELGVPAFRDWVLNDIGSASFPVKALGLEKYIEFGNYALLEHDKLEPWVGVIITPRPWAMRVATVNAKSAMSIFSVRVGSYQQAVSGSWGQVFAQLIEVVNSQGPTLLEVGNYTEGVSYASVVDMSNPYIYLQRALLQAQTRLDFRPVVTNGRLRIFIDMQPTLYTSNDLRLEEGLNIKNNVNALLEQGEIYNDVTVLGVSLDQVKFTARAIDPVSVERYGLRQTLISEGQSQADVDRLAAVYLQKYAYPRKTLGLITLDKGDTFEKTRVGNTAFVELKTQGYINNGLGFRGNAYIRVVQFDDRNGEGVLVCEEIVNG